MKYSCEIPWFCCGKKLDLNPHVLASQLTEIESKKSKLYFLLAIVKSEHDKVASEKWSHKSRTHGEQKRNEAQIADEIKEYTYLRTLIEGMIDGVDGRLSLGKKLLEHGSI